MKKKSTGTFVNIIVISIMVLIMIGIFWAIYSFILKVDAQPPAVKAPKTPAEVYREFNKAELSGDFRIIRTFLSNTHQKIYDSWDEERFITEGAEIKKNAATNYKVIKETIDGNKAELYLEGNTISFMTGRQAPYGKITFSLEDGEWKILKSNWVEKPELLDDSEN